MEVIGRTLTTTFFSNKYVSRHFDTVASTHVLTNRHFDKNCEVLCIHCIMSFGENGCD